jgi:hypothetical protein
LQQAFFLILRKLLLHVFFLVLIFARFNKI